MENREEFFKVKDKETGKKIVYITADKKCMSYAFMLQTLISTVKDVKCCIYTLEVYKNNMDKSSSENLIIFIGKNEISDSTIKLLYNKINKNKDYGIWSGYIGTRAVLWRESIFWKFRLRNGFYKYYEEKYTEFQRIIEPYNAKAGIADIAAFIGLGLIGVGVKKAIIEGVSISKKLKQAQYNACLMEFVENGLPEFVKER